MACSVKSISRHIRFLWVHSQGRETLNRQGLHANLEFAGATEASADIAAIELSHADLILMDSQLSESAWRDVLALTRKPCILLGSANFGSVVIPCLIAGARGYLTDREYPGKVQEAAETVLAEEIYAGPALTWHLLKHLAGLSAAPETPSREQQQASEELTVSETRILNLIANGLSNHGIAETLCVSPHTVANHVHNVLKKLKARHRWEAVGMSEELRLHREMNRF
jgi:DNA-binding NarL/FixJ family response regulator